MKALSIDIVQKSYLNNSLNSTLTALENVSLTINKGQFTCIVGPSGCGKTTLLNLIGGLDQDFEGVISVGGLPPGEGPLIGHMFQSPRLMPWLNVRENVGLVVAKDNNNDVRIDALLEEMGLGNFTYSYPKSLSGGMRRRAALARAFITEPDLLLLDEPFLSLDVPVANRLRNMLLNLCERHSATALFVTHDLREAVYLGDRLLFMSGSPGHIVLDLLVDLPRPRMLEGPEVESFRLALLKEHPDLLAGLVEEAESETKVQISGV